MVRDIVAQLVRGEYQSFVAQFAASRLTADDLRQVIQNYGRTLILPPDPTYPDLNIVQVRGAIRPTWSIQAPLWTREEGRSDLTLELTITVDGDHRSVELEDLHVL